jgi:thiol-disulfide isomerase/thioredoxin
MIGDSGPAAADDRRQARRRATLLIGVAAVAGIVAGAVGVYVNHSGDGKRTDAASVNCAGVPETARRLDPLARGEVAAFRVAQNQDLLTGLAFTGPDNAPLTLADFSGKVVLVNLWATWCVPCRAEMPALDRLQQDLGGDDFAVVAVNVDVNDPERARAFLADIGVSALDFYADPTMRILNELRKRGLAIGLPTTLLVDAKGCKIGVVEGPAAWDSEDAKALVRAALG